MNENVEKFRSLIRGWCGAYRWVIVSYIALRKEETSTPIIMVGKLTFVVTLDEQLKAASSQCLVTPHIVADRKAFSITNNLDIILLALSEGRLEVSDVSCELLADNNRLDYHVQPYYPYSQSEGPRFPTLYIRGMSRWNITQHTGVDMDDIDWELKASDTPFDNLNELLTFYGLERSDSVMITVSAATPAVIRADSSISGRNAYVRCGIADTLLTEHLKFGYKVIGRNGIERGSRRGDEFDWRDENGFRIGDLSLPVGEAPLLQGFLSVIGDRPRFNDDSGFYSDKNYANMYLTVTPL